MAQYCGSKTTRFSGTRCALHSVPRACRHRTVFLHCKRIPMLLHEVWLRIFFCSTASTTAFGKLQRLMLIYLFLLNLVRCLRFRVPSIRACAPCTVYCGRPARVELFRPDTLKRYVGFGRHWIVALKGARQFLGRKSGLQNGFLVFRMFTVFLTKGRFSIFPIVIFIILIKHNATQEAYKKTDW